eukprot:s884_g35.t1
MPIAGRENRLSTSGSLETTEVWKKAVRYDPYAGEGEDQGEVLGGSGEINSSAKGLFRLAQLTGHSSTIAPGACKRCGSVGHLYFQCRNMFTLRKEEKKLDQFVEEEEDDEDPGSEDVPSSDSDESDSDDSDSEEESSSSSSAKKKKKKKSKKKDKKEKSKKKKKKEKSKKRKK